MREFSNCGQIFGVRLPLWLSIEVDPSRVAEDAPGALVLFPQHPQEPCADEIAEQLAA